MPVSQIVEHRQKFYRLVASQNPQQALIATYICFVANVTGLQLTYIEAN